MCGGFIVLRWRIDGREDIERGRIPHRKNDGYVDSPPGGGLFHQAFADQSDDGVGHAQSVSFGVFENRGEQALVGDSRVVGGHGMTPFVVEEFVFVVSKE